MVPDEIYDNFSTNQTAFHTRLFNKIKKAKMLLYKQLGGPPALNGAWLINKSDYDIPLNVQYFLSLGDEYNLPYSVTDFPLEQLIVDVEYILQAIGDDSEKTEKRNKQVESKIKNSQKSWIQLHRYKRSPTRSQSARATMSVQEKLQTTTSRNCIEDIQLILGLGVV
nr:unnamed protein product [Callosobruchus analis]